MNEYLLSIIGVILLSAILTAILPDGKTSGLIRSVMRMACILTIISPILTFFHSGSLTVGAEKKSNINSENAVIEMDAEFIHYYSEMRISEAESALESEIFEKFHVDCDVTLHWQLEPEMTGKTVTTELIKITKMHIKTIAQQQEEVLKEMWEYLMKNYCSEVLIE